MPFMRWSAHLVAAILAMCSAASGQEDPWAPLELIAVKTEQATIWIDPALAQHRERIVEQLDADIAAARLLRESGMRIANDHREAAVDRANELCGFEVDAELFQRQVLVLDQFNSLGWFQFADPSALEIRVLLMETTKDYLRTGASLPSFAYDPKTDTATYELYVEGRGDADGSATDPIIVRSLAIPVESEATLDDCLQLPSSFAAFSGSSIVIAIHEVVELAFLTLARPVDPHIRWFSDGLANVVTMQVLADLDEPDLPALLAESLDTARYADLRRQSNLRYWPMPELENHWPVLKPMSPVESECRLRLGRYAFAHDEIDRLVQASGWDALRDVLDQACEAEALDSGKLIEIIKTVTGENLSTRLYRYQPFHELDEGAQKYAASVAAAERAGDAEREYVDLMRLTELSLARGYYPNLYARSAELLARMGHVQAGHAVLRHHLDFVTRRGPDNRATMLAHIVNFALIADAPELAYDVAESLLVEEPGDVMALSVRAHRLHAEGDAAAAQRLAAELLGIEGATFRPPVEAMLERIAAPAPEGS